MIETPRTRTICEYVPRGHGHLRVFRTYVGDSPTPVVEVFTLASMADVLGISRDALAGRYNRSGLKHMVTYVHTGESRPQRAFPLASYEAVVAALTNPGAVVSVAGNETRVVHRSRIRRPGGIGEVAILHAGERYYTIDALADFYGVSTTTVRNRIGRVAGLMEKAESLHTFTGGRPRRAWHERHEAALVDAMEGGSALIEAATQAMARASTARVEIAQRRPNAQWTGAPGLYASAPNHETTAPAEYIAPVNEVNSFIAELDALAEEEGIKPRVQSADEFMDDLMKELGPMEPAQPLDTPTKASTPSSPAAVERSVVDRDEIVGVKRVLAETIASQPERPTREEIAEAVGAFKAITHPRQVEELVSWVEQVWDPAWGKAQQQLVATLSDRLNRDLAALDEYPGDEVWRRVTVAVGAMGLDCDLAAFRKKWKVTTPVPMTDEDHAMMDVGWQVRTHLSIHEPKGTMAEIADIDECAAGVARFVTPRVSIDTAREMVERLSGQVRALLEDPDRPFVDGLEPPAEEEIDMGAVAAALKQLTKKAKK